MEGTEKYPERRIQGVRTPETEEREVSEWLDRRQLGPRLMNRLLARDFRRRATSDRPSDQAEGKSEQFEPQALRKNFRKGQREKTPTTERSTIYRCQNAAIFKALYLFRHLRSLKSGLNILGSGGGGKTACLGAGKKVRENATVSLIAATHSRR